MWFDHNVSIIVGLIDTTSPYIGILYPCNPKLNERYTKTISNTHERNVTCSKARPAVSLRVHQVAMKHPSAVTACNLDLENLITDSNRSIATLAITTLLKTGSESSVDRLMKQISSFVSEISDEFKVRSVYATLC